MSKVRVVGVRTVDGYLRKKRDLLSSDDPVDPLILAHDEAEWLESVEARFADFHGTLMEFIMQIGLDLRTHAKELRELE